MELPSCPLCLDALSHPATTQCGHVFCTACLRAVHRADARELACPVCRARVTLLIPLYSLSGPDNARADDVAFLREFAVARRGGAVAAQLRDVALEDYQLAQRAFRSSWLFRVAVIASLLVVAAYFVSPIDLIPDAIPVLGRADDVFAVVLLGWLWVALAQRERERLLRDVWRAP